jgi:hypothetical protein
LPLMQSITAVQICRSINCEVLNPFLFGTSRVFAW